MDDEFKCNICGKVCKSAAGLKSHKRSCIEPAPIIEPTPIIKTIKDELVEFFSSLNGRRTHTRKNLLYMFSIFKLIYPDSKVHFNPDCGSCCAQIYNRLKDYYEKIK